VHSERAIEGKGFSKRPDITNFAKETMSLHREQIKRETQFARIAKKAQSKPDEIFTSLSHYLSEEFLISSFRKLRKSAASGLDGETCYDYELNLLANIQALYTRLRSWEYKAPNIRRTWIDKGGGKKRPLGIGATEDKVVQRAVTDILNTIYEQDFYEFSYGFRKKRSAHQALKQVHGGCMGRKIKWVLDADIQGCFDNFDHQILRDLLSKRINDKWMVETVKPLLKGEMFIVRYADDFVIGFENYEDAQRVFNTLPKRMGKYGLSIHPEKTQLLKFAAAEKGMRVKTATFDFLGFTHY